MQPLGRGQGGGTQPSGMQPLAPESIARIGNKHRCSSPAPGEGELPKKVHGEAVNVLSKKLRLKRAAQSYHMNKAEVAKDTKPTKVCVLSFVYF